MKVLIIGGGGREHALAWKSARSALVSEVLCAPGNAGTALEHKVRNVAVGADDIDGLVALARTESVELTIVGPEQPLVAGIADRFEAEGLKCFGPKAAAARLEGSKSFAKDFFARHGIPTAGCATFEAIEPARRYIAGRPLPAVIKADGLAAGKGVIIVHTADEADQALRGMLERHDFGDAGKTIVIENFLSGEEASFTALVDGTRIVPLASSQDHKARDDGDRGPNTGGMGAYSPAPVVGGDVNDRIMAEVMRPAVEGLVADGIDYRGFLYAGLMIDEHGAPRALEFNCRFGDPETQPILFRLRSDLVAVCLESFGGTLDDVELDWDPRAAVGVVTAAAGYPGGYEKHKPITGLDGIDSDTVKVFHSGTRLDAGRILTNGGRVLCTVALGDSVSQARQRAYAAVGKIHWEGAFCRSDIGYRAVARERGGAA